MATPLTKTSPTVDGVTDVAEADLDTANGNSVPALSPRTIIVVRNADGAGAHSVTFVTSFQAGGLDLADKTVSIPASESRTFAQFDPKYYGRTMTITGDSAQLKLKVIEA